MKNNCRVRWTSGLVALLLAWPPLGQATGSGSYQVEGFTVTPPAGWQAEGDGSGGMLRWSFQDTDGTPGICILTVNSAGGAVPSEEALQQVALSLGAGAYTMETAGERDVLLCDLKQGDSHMGGAIFMEQGKSLVVMVRLSGPVNAIRQQDIALDLVGRTVYGGESADEAEMPPKPQADGKGNMVYPVGSLTLTVPQDWTQINPEVEGQLQLQFTDAGVRGVCVMVPRLVGQVEEGDKTRLALEEMAASLKGQELEMTTVSGRDVLLCEVEERGLKVSVGLMMEGNQLVVLTVCLVDTDHVARQRLIVQSLAGAVRTGF